MRNVKILFWKTRAGALALALVFGMALAGCNNIHDVSVGGSQEGTATPYAGAETLNALAAADGFVNWQVARFFALDELAGIKNDNGWQGTELSEYPLVIYHAETGTPRYYEFRVLQGNTEVGAISCATEKTEGTPVQYVLPFVNAISDTNARAVSLDEGKLIDAGYPRKLLMREANSSRSVDAATGEIDVTEYPVEVRAKEFLENAPAEILEGFGITSQELIDHYIAEETEKERTLAAFWDEVDNVTENILNMTEEELEEVFGDDSAARLSTGTDYSNTYLLADWENKKDWYNGFGQYCGPDAVGFVMLGLGTNSGYAGIPTTNDYDQLKTFYIDVVQADMGEDAKYYYWFDGKSLNGTLTRLTGNRYQIAAHWGTPLLFYHSWVTVNDEIRRTNLPVISLRTFTLAHIVNDGKSGFHYRVVMGTRKAESYIKAKVLWWTVKIVYWTEGQYRMHDNGTDGKTWWESPSLYHFQAASVVKN